MLVSNRGWFFSICFIATLITSVSVWGQALHTFQEEPKNTFLKPYEPAKDYGISDTFSTTNKDNDYKKISIGAPHKKTIATSPKKAHKSHHGKQGEEQKSKNQDIIQEKDAAGKSTVSLGYQQNNTTDSASFLDGYLLKSLKEEKIVRKKAADENQLDENIKIFLKRRALTKR